MCEITVHAREIIWEHKKHQNFGLLGTPLGSLHRSPTADPPKATPRSQHFGLGWSNWGVPKLLLNRGHSEPCYATVHRMSLIIMCDWEMVNSTNEHEYKFGNDHEINTNVIATILNYVANGMWTCFRYFSIYFSGDFVMWKIETSYTYVEVIIRYYPVLISAHQSWSVNRL